ncbi:hypothetical protein FXW07_07175 [Methanosarcina sp. DH1]|uniref:hypothetical protein n=1 Tax=Methanosarcina sp. DH1 TaxID=2605695 RepID=UPI001E326932|nr:hypothetical protein [Methanosarcina sp. DH1]MCC4766401.1 hypothetical protein [Methanosarcina sp. DH1]
MKILMDENEHLIYNTYLENRFDPLAAILQLICITEPELLLIPEELQESEELQEPETEIKPEPEAVING